MDSSGSTPAAPRIAALLGLVAGSAFLVLGYTTIAELPRAPGDWLWNGAVSATDERIAVGGPLVDAAYESADLSSRSLALQRAPGFVSILLTLFGLGWLAARRTKGGTSLFLTPIAVLASVGLLPLALEDPSEVLSETKLCAPLFAVLAAVLPLPARGFVVGALSGACVPLFAGVDLDLGAALFAAGCATLATKSVVQGGLAVVAHVVVSFAAHSALGLEAPIAPGHWWTDAATGSSAALDLLRTHGFSLSLAAIGAALVVFARTAGAAFAIAAVGISMALAASNVRLLQERAGILTRDSKTIAEVATDTRFRLLPHVLLNIPMHVRPEIVGRAGGLAVVARHEAMRTLDLGASIHIPFDWEDLEPSRPVLRRLPGGGFERTSVQRLLDLETVPLAGIVRGEVATLETALRDAPRSGTLQRALGDAVSFDASVRAEERGTVTTVERDGAEGVRMMVAVDPSDRRAVDASYLQPSPSHAVAVSPKLEIEAHVANFGVIVRVPADVKKLELRPASDG